MSSIRSGGNVTVVIRTPVKGGCLKVSRLSVRTQSNLCKLAVAIVVEAWCQKRIQSIPGPLKEELLEIGILVPKRLAPSDVNFRVELDENLLELVPYRNRETCQLDLDAEELVLNESVYLDDHVNFVGKRKRNTQTLGTAESGLIWVEDPGTQILSPYWTTSELNICVRGLLSGEIRPSSVKPEYLNLLLAANILVVDGWTDTRIQQWKENIRYAQESIQLNRYAIIRNILHPLQLSALRRYFRALNLQGFLLEESTTSEMVANRRISHNEKITRFLHYQILDLAQRITAEEIKTSYSMLCLYSEGAFLRKHIDREQCVWNLSLLVDSDPEAEISESWPIYLDVGKPQPKRVCLEIGDGVLFSGTKTPHWRNRLPSGRSVTVGFFHFVPVQFKGSID